MNLDYYYTFRFYCNALLQQAALFPRHVDRFFLSGGDSTENAHMHTLARTQHTTHHSSKSISGFFFYYYCLFCLCFGILYYYYYYHHYSTVQVTLLFCFNFGLSCCLLFYYFLWPSSDTRELKIQDLPNKDPLSQKAFHCMEYKNKKQRSIPYPHAPHRARLCTSYHHNQQSNPVSVIPCLRPASGNVWQPSSADLNTKRGKPALAMHLTLHRVADRALLVGKPNFFEDTYQLKKYSVKGPRCRSSGVGQG